MILMLSLYTGLGLYSDEAILIKQENGRKVASGLELLLEDPESRLKGKRIGLIVNHSSINSERKHSIDLLYPKFNVVKLFAPEHGIRGEKDDFIKDNLDPGTKLPVISLYTGKKKAPSDSDLRDVDILIFDMQEIGVRYYTYATTLILCMKAAKSANRPILVLDRPNMAGRLGVFGPVLDREFLGGFAGYYPVPMSHGLTIGELAVLCNSEFSIGADLKVVQMRNYRHDLFYDETGLPWVNPSPNIREADAAIAYHLIGSLETLDMSVGRGTAAPFLLYGSPHFNGESLVKGLEAAGLPGLKFEKAVFTPKGHTYSGRQCQGFRMVITDRKKIDPMLTLLTVARQIYLHLPEKNRYAGWMRACRGVGSRKLFMDIANGVPNEKLIAGLTSGNMNFIGIRKKYLLYP